MRHRAPAEHPDLPEDGVLGVVRISGAYPPPPPVSGARPTALPAPRGPSTGELVRPVLGGTVPPPTPAVRPIPDGAVPPPPLVVRMVMPGVVPPPPPGGPRAPAGPAASRTSAQPTDVVPALPAVRFTRYDHARPVSRHASPSRPPTRAWTGASALLAAAGVGALAFWPAPAPEPVRLDPPAAVATPDAVAAPAAADAPAAVAAPTVTAAPSFRSVLPSVGTDVVPAASARALPASRPVQVQIPALGVSSPVIALDLADDGTMQTPPGAYPVGWYDRSPTPGQLGPSVLAGHVDWKGEHGAFWGLRALRAGDTVVVDRADGTAATFRVDRVQVSPKDAFPTDAVYGPLDHAGLRLVTCGGPFDAATGNYRDNVLVFASLAEG